MNMRRTISVSGVGCCLVDRVYTNISFRSELFSRYLSKKRGDGGLTPGRLVFKEEFESFSGSDLEKLVVQLASGKPPEKISIGGPGIVAMIHAAQMASGSNCTFHFYGRGGKDSDGHFLLEAMADTPVLTDHYQLDGKVTPFTMVLSDPTYDNGTGERIFINTIGAARDYTPDALDHRFFSSDVVVFGGTALVPAIHDHLTMLLSKAKANRCITIVNTVYDFRNEKANPDQKWPLGESDESYAHIDLLITDLEEALRLSGKPGIQEAMQFFKSKGSAAVIVTNGVRNIRLYAGSKSIFSEIPDAEMPVSNSISGELEMAHNGDTTGCGDNFAGGVIYSVASQLDKGNIPFDLKEACRWGIVSGGYACFYIGGTYMEDEPGEKLRKITPYYTKYPG
jgi:sugar/nucleoside kinase (ribokinase family)